MFYEPKVPHNRSSERSNKRSSRRERGLIRDIKTKKEIRECDRFGVCIDTVQTFITQLIPLRAVLLEIFELQSNVMTGEVNVVIESREFSDEVCVFSHFIVHKNDLGKLEIFIVCEDYINPYTHQKELYYELKLVQKWDDNSVELEPTKQQEDQFKQPNTDLFAQLHPFELIKELAPNTAFSAQPILDLSQVMKDSNDDIQIALHRVKSKKTTIECITKSPESRSTLKDSTVTAQMNKQVRQTWLKVIQKLDEFGLGGLYDATHLKS